MSNNETTVQHSEHEIRMVPPIERKKKKSTFLKQIERYAGYMLLRLCAFIVKITGEKKSAKFGIFMGRCFCKMDKRYGAVAVRNLKFIYPEKSDKEIESMALKNLENFGKSASEFLRLPYMTDGELLRRTYFSGDSLDIVKKAYSKGKGVLLLTAHFGNWEIMSARYNYEGFIVDAIARDPELKATANFMHQTREQRSLRRMYPNKNLLPVMRALKEGRGIGILPDQHDMHGIVIDFLGHKARMAVGPAAIALRSGAPIVPTFAIRQPNDIFEIIAMPEISIKQTGNADADIHRVTQQLADAISEIIKNYPTQWLWFHDRWRPNVHMKSEPEPYVEDNP